MIEQIKEALKTSIILVLAYSAAVILIYAYNRIIPTGAVLTFYRDTDLSKPVWKSVSKKLTFFSKKSPCIGVGKRYSCRWEGYLDVPAGADYDFAVLNHGGLRLYLDDHLFIDNWGEKDFYGSLGKGMTNLSAGKHKITVEYYCNGDYGRMRVEWCGGSIPSRTIVGGKYLFKSK